MKKFILSQRWDYEAILKYNEIKSKIKDKLSCGLNIFVYYFKLFPKSWFLFSKFTTLVVGNISLVEHKPPMNYTCLKTPWGFGPNCKILGLEDYFVEQRTTLFIGGLLCLSEDYSAREDYSAVTAIHFLGFKKFIKGNI
jgi:hypothetical protein